MDRSHHDLKPGPVTRCNVCGSERLEPIIDLGRQPLCDSLLGLEELGAPEVTYPLRLVTCRDCSLTQIDYIVDGSTVFHKGYPYRSGITRELADHHRRLSTEVVKRVGVPRDSLVVDIGSNDGTLLLGFQAQGMRVAGVEPTDIAKIAVDAGVETMQRFFDEAAAQDIVASHGKAKVITATNVFAHMAPLGAVLRGITQLLDDDGVFVVETHYLLDIINRVQYDSIYHEHIRYYTIKSLMKLFSYYDLSIIDAHRVASYGGSLRVFVSKNKGEEPSSAVGNLIAEEADAGLYDLAIYREFAERTLKARRDLVSLIHKVHESGERIVANSCPGRAATLLNFCNIDHYMIPYIAEQPTSLKLGLYAPGTSIPVVDNSILLREQPDYVLLLAWHYATPIATLLRERGLKSKLIVPLPELTILD